MNALCCEAVILRRSLFSETSLIVTLFSRTHGRIEALAKGARRPKAPLRGHLDLFNLEEVMVLPRERAGLDLLTDAYIVSEFVRLRQRHQALAAASLAADLLMGGLQVYDPHPGSFDALLCLLQELEADRPVMPATVRALLAILSDLGFRPQLDRCVGCDKNVPAGRSLALSGVQGGICCPACRGRVRGGVLVPPAALSALRMLQQKPSADVEAGRAEWARLLRALVRYAEDSYGHGLRSGACAVRMLLEAA